MKKILTSLLITVLMLSLAITFTSKAEAVECYGKLMHADLTFSPTEVKAGETVKLTVQINNCSYKDEYEEEDFQLSNPGVQIQSGTYKQYLEPAEDWVVPVPSMVNQETLSYTKTYRIKENTPLGYFGGFSVVTWLDKSDPSSMDHDTQGKAPLVINAAESSVTQEQEGTQQQTENTGEASQLQIQIHNRYFENNSSTTRIDKMNQNQLRNVENFTLEIANKNKVMFKSKINLSTEARKKKLNQMDEYVDLTEKGKITIDTEYLDFLNEPAHITMYDLPFTSTPLIYKDGELVTSEEVSNIVYNYSVSEKTGTLDFDVTSFSTYEAVANKRLPTEPFINYQVEDNSMARMLFLIGLITLIGIGTAVGVKMIEKKRIAATKEDKA